MQTCCLTMSTLSLLCQVLVAHLQWLCSLLVLFSLWLHLSKLIWTKLHFCLRRLAHHQQANVWRHCMLPNSAWFTATWEWSSIASMGLGVVNKWMNTSPLCSHIASTSVPLWSATRNATTIWHECTCWYAEHMFDSVHSVVNPERQLIRSIRWSVQQ